VECKYETGELCSRRQRCYGVVVGDGVVTLKGHGSLRDALAAGALDE
jgi:hypothetical protein